MNETINKTNSDTINETNSVTINETNSVTINELDIPNLRIYRQTETNDKLCEILKQDNISIKDIEKICNMKELDRLLKYNSKQMGKSFTFQDFHNKCKNDPIYLYSIAPRISKNSARQGSKDETTVLNFCNRKTSESGVIIEQLPNDSLRPHKYSKKLITKKEYEKGKGEYKKNDCLKSFDAKISGKKEGYIFAKVCIGCGGHQDNVFEEAHNFGDWAHEYGEEGNMYIILIDTDQNEKYADLKTKFKDKSKVYVVNHVELQKLLIN